MEFSSPIYLVSASVSRRQRRRIAHQGAIQGAKWLYLGRDYPTMKSWESILESRVPRLHYAEQLQNIAQTWRTPYVQWIAAKGKEYNNLIWWSSRIAERNTYIYSLYHDICYLQIARMFAQSTATPLIIVAERASLLRAIAREPEVKERIRWVQHFLPLRAWLVWFARFSFVWMRYLVRAFQALRDARITRKDCPSNQTRSMHPRVLMHSCIDESYFGQDGSVHDRYFTKLPQVLRAQGYEVVIIPWLSNIKRSRREVFAWFRAHPGEFLIPEDYYTIFDYLWSAWVVIQQIRLCRGRQFFEGKDITLLVREANRRGAVDTGLPVFVRYVRLIKKLQHKGYRVNIFLDKFENMVTEKPQIIAFRKYMPQVRTVGFQHWLVSPFLQLHMVTTPDEAAIAPHPDVIVCNASFSADLFRKEGFPPGKLRIGPSLRYLHLLEGETLPIGKISKEKAVLVVFPLDFSLAAEIIAKILEAFPQDEGIRFYLKIHPMMSRSRWLDIIAVKSLPSHLMVTQGEMAHCMNGVQCAITSGSTAAVELVLAGLPTVIIGQDTDIEMNPFAGFTESDPPVRSRAQLRDTVLRILSFSGEADKVHSWIKEYRKAMLSPLNKETIRTFIEADFPRH